MRAQTIEIQDSVGRVLCNTVFRSGGRKLLAKGHIINQEDLRLLTDVGLNQVSVSELETGETSEDQAVRSVAAEVGCGCLEIRVVAGGRANLIATENSCLLVDDDLLRQVNSTPAVVVATTLNFSYVKAGQRIATIKSSPFAVASEQLAAVISILKDRGPLLQARPIRKPQVGAIYCDPANGDRARRLFEATVRQRLERLGAVPNLSINCPEEEISISRAISQLLLAKPNVVVIASTTTPAGPEDAVGRAMARLGCEIERFLAPVEPGNLFLLGYKDEIPIISAPGCFRSTKQNVVDLVLPPVLARYKVTGWEVACLGHGGLLA